MALSHLKSDYLTSRGRFHDEPPSATRSPFARDHDRVIHCTAFRRLKGKTQVFVANDDDYFRTRLTHSLEVAQIARSLARTLGLDMDLAETIALSHDLGHPPFGHAGEDALHACMQPYGGFDHNVQTFRIVTSLEARYPAFSGLNLSWETVEGIIKHNGPVSHQVDNPSWEDVFHMDAAMSLDLGGLASLEAQAAAIADDIAYNNHDIDDGLRAGLFGIEDLLDVPIIGDAIKATKKDWPLLEARMIRLEAVRRMFGAMLKDVIEESLRRVKSDAIMTAHDVRQAQRPMIGFSTDMLLSLARLRGFLYERMYKHYKLNRTRSLAKRTLKALFCLFMEEPDILPPQWHEGFRSKVDANARARIVCDYLAGMTDAYAISEYKKLFSFEPS